MGVDVGPGVGPGCPTLCSSFGAQDPTRPSRGRCESPLAPCACRRRARQRCLQFLFLLFCFPLPSFLVFFGVLRPPLYLTAGEAETQGALSATPSPSHWVGTVAVGAGGGTALCDQPGEEASVCRAAAVGRPGGQCPRGHGEEAWHSFRERMQMWSQTACGATAWAPSQPCR